MNAFICTASSTPRERFHSFLRSFYISVSLNISLTDTAKWIQVNWGSGFYFPCWECTRICPALQCRANGDFSRFSKIGVFEIPIFKPSAPWLLRFGAGPLTAALWPQRLRRRHLGYRPQRFFWRRPLTGGVCPFKIRVYLFF